MPNSPDAFSASKLTAEDARKILEPFSPDHLLDILQNAVIRHPDVLDNIRSIADRDLTRPQALHTWPWMGHDNRRPPLPLFAYGDLDEAVVIVDKATGKSKGYGFVNSKHIDGALLALKEPSKKIDGRMTVTQEETCERSDEEECRRLLRVGTLL